MLDPRPAEVFRPKTPTYSTHDKELRALTVTRRAARSWRGAQATSSPRRNHRDSSNPPRSLRVSLPTQTPLKRGLRRPHSAATPFFAVQNSLQDTCASFQNLITGNNTRHCHRHRLSAKGAVTGKRMMAS